jgi:hypothetical protein
MGRASHPAYKVKFTSDEITKITDRDNFRNFELSCVVENTSELVGRDVSAIAFVPEHLISRADEYRVVIDGATCSRIPGTWIVAPRDSRTAIDLHPISPCRVCFQRELKCTLSMPSHLRITIRVYDQFGLAQTTRITLSTPAFETITVEELSTPGTPRQASISPF